MKGFLILSCLLSLLWGIFFLKQEALYDKNLFSCQWHQDKIQFLTCLKQTTKNIINNFKKKSNPNIPWKCLSTKTITINTIKNSNSIFNHLIDENKCPYIGIDPIIKQSYMKQWSSLMNIRNGNTEQKIFPNEHSLETLLFRELRIHEKRTQILKNKLSLKHNNHIDITNERIKENDSIPVTIRRTLFAITTKNLLDITKITLYSLRTHEHIPDILIVDDASIEPVPQSLISLFSEELPIVSIIKKEKAKGLTDSWNVAYQYFKNETKYEYLLIANNDLLLPESSIKWMSYCLSSGYSLCKPLGNKIGVGDRPSQNVWPYISNAFSEQETQYPEHYNQIQNELDQQTILYPFWKDNIPFNGFIFGMRRDAMLAAEYDSRLNLLFNPENINVRNENDLTVRLPKIQHTLCLKCYVYHFKKLTLQASEAAINNSINTNKSNPSQEIQFKGDPRDILVDEAGIFK